MFETPPLATLQSTLSNPTTPIGMRMRATYFLRQIYDDARRNAVSDRDATNADAAADGDDALALQTFTAQLRNPLHGSLLRHEFAYVLGQMRDPRALPALEATLLSRDEDPMIRHECAEALGAIGSPSSAEALRRCSDDESPEVGQTCLLALDFMEWKTGGGGGRERPPTCACALGPYSSHDPAPAHPAHVDLSARQIGEMLLDGEAPLFQRFRAMFSLRNRGGEDSVRELGGALLGDASSALLRHEVAYVLGQMRHPAGVEYLAASLKREGEHRMVRHESAEALGAIEERWGECQEVLRQFLEDEDPVVRESCAVALDAADYFGYAKENEERGEEGAERVNFSLHKAEVDGRKGDGVLHNHFNIVA